MGLSGPLIISLLKQNSFFQLSMLPLHHWMKREGVVQHPVTSRANRYFPSLVVFENAQDAVQSACCKCGGRTGTV